MRFVMLFSMLVIVGCTHAEVKNETSRRPSAENAVPPECKISGEGRDSQVIRPTSFRTNDFGIKYYNFNIATDLTAEIWNDGSCMESCSFTKYVKVSLSDMNILSSASHNQREYNFPDLEIESNGRKIYIQCHDGGPAPSNSSIGEEPKPN